MMHAPGTSGTGDLAEGVEAAEGNVPDHAPDLGEFALNAVSLTPMALDEFKIEVADAKINYLKSQKAGSIERAGLQEITTEQLAAFIRAKISGSYIYNLSHDQTHNVTKFNINIELPPAADRPATRLLAALEYQPDRKTLRLITLF